MRTSRRTGGHSFPNVLLIAAGRADATLAASYEQWQALGRQVGKDSAACRSSPDQTPKEPVAAM